MDTGRILVLKIIVVCCNGLSTIKFDDLSTMKFDGLSTMKFVMIVRL